MRVLITGASGFVGRHLVEFLSTRKGVEVHPVSRRQCDLRDAGQVKRVLKQVRPARIFHLAAQSSVPVSLKSPMDTLMNNISAEVNLLEAVRALGLKSRVHVAGSSDVYGRVPGTAPIRESRPFRPLSPYGVSKAAQELLAFQYSQRYGLFAVCTRAFNHTGPGQSENFVASDFARQVARIERGSQEAVVHVGDLAVSRDFTDVRDVVRAYWLALEKGRPGEAYNVCSGRARTIREIVHFFLKQSRVKFKIKPERVRMRSQDILRMVGDASRFRKQTGWRPLVPFEKTLLDLLNYWRDVHAGNFQKTHSR